MQIDEVTQKERMEKDFREGHPHYHRMVAYSYHRGGLWPVIAAGLIFILAAILLLLGQTGLPGNQDRLLAEAERLVTQGKARRVVLERNGTRLVIEAAMPAAAKPTKKTPPDGGESP